MPWFGQGSGTAAPSVGWGGGHSLRSCPDGQRSRRSVVRERWSRGPDDVHAQPVVVAGERSGFAVRGTRARRSAPDLRRPDLVLAHDVEARAACRSRAGLSSARTLRIGGQRCRCTSHSGERRSGGVRRAGRRARGGDRPHHGGREEQRTHRPPLVRRRRGGHGRRRVAGRRELPGVLRCSTVRHRLVHGGGRGDVAPRRTVWRPVDIDDTVGWGA